MFSPSTTAGSCVKIASPPAAVSAMEKPVSVSSARKKLDGSVLVFTSVSVQRLEMV